MSRPEPLERPLVFLGSFCLAAILLLPVWIYASRLYLGASVGLVNACTGWLGLPAAFQLPGPAGDAITNPSIVALAALFVATPQRSWRWRAGWIAGAILFFWVLHSLLLLLQVYLAFSHAAAPAAAGGYLEALPELGRRWAFPVLSLLLWYVAVRVRPGPARGAPGHPAT